MGFYILTQTKQQNLDGILHITADEDSRICIKFYVLMQTRQQDLDGIVHITADKTVGFGSYSKY